MKKLSKVFLIVLIACLMLAVVVMGLYISKNDIGTLRQERIDNMETIDGLNMLLKDKDFSYTACKMEIDNLEQTIKSKDELILELKVKEKTLELAMETLEYCLLYIEVQKIKMDQAGLIYPEFILDTILTDNYFEDIKEQENVFEEMDE